MKTFKIKKMETKEIAVEKTDSKVRFETIIVLFLIVIAAFAAFSSSKFLLAKHYKQSFLDAAENVKKYPALYDRGFAVEQKEDFVDKKIPLSFMASSISVIFIWGSIVALAAYILRKHLYDKNGNDKIPFTTPLVVSFVATLFIIYFLCNIDATYAYRLLGH